MRKILKMKLITHYSYFLEKGWVSPEKLSAKPSLEAPKLEPDIRG